MSVTADLAAVQRRVASIAGASAAGAPNPGAPATGAHSAGAREPGLARVDAFRALVDGRLEGVVREEARAAGLDPALVSAVVRAESSFDPRATSATGAAGLMQLMPATAQALGVSNPYDPAQNVRAGASYLRELLERFGGDLRSALAAYNAGPAVVERYGGVPPFAETQAYVARILGAYRRERVP